MDNIKSAKALLALSYACNFFITNVQHITEEFNLPAEETIELGLQILNSSWNDTKKELEELTRPKQ